MDLFYSSRHGLQEGGEYYLVPVDGEIPSERDAPRQSLPLSTVLTGLRDGGSHAWPVVAPRYHSVA